VPDPGKIGEQSSINKQGRQDAPNLLMKRGEERQRLINHCTESFKLYKELLESGWPRELARSVLPLGTYSHMFAKVDLKNLFDFFRLRCDPHAQYEIRVYAEAMLEMIRPIVPVAVAAFEESTT
jgi:thymidylate synthase (FAD)